MSKKNKIFLSTDYPELNNPFNTLAANIKFASIDKNIKTITVTSTVANEGKTNIVLNLGISLANNNKRVLLIDGDMRKRSIAKCLDIHPKFGLYSILSGKCAINEGIYSTHIDRLFLIDSEPNIPNPVDIVSSNMFARLMDFVNSKFDYVIVDTPPLQTFVDGAIISSLTDATILAVRQKLAKKNEVANAIEQLDAAKANLIGTILTFNADFKKSQYYYAYYNYEGKRVGDSKNKQMEQEFVPDAVARQNLNTWYQPKSGGSATKRQTSMNNNLQNNNISHVQYTDYHQANAGQYGPNGGNQYAGVNVVPEIGPQGQPQGYPQGQGNVGGQPQGNPYAQVQGQGNVGVSGQPNGPVQGQHNHPAQAQVQGHHNKHGKHGRKKKA